MKSVVQIASLAVVIVSYFLRSFQGASLQTNGVTENKVEIVDGAQVGRERYFVTRQLSQYYRSYGSNKIERFIWTIQ